MLFVVGSCSSFSSVLMVQLGFSLDVSSWEKRE